MNAAERREISSVRDKGANRELKELKPPSPPLSQVKVERKDKF